MKITIEVEGTVRVVQSIIAVVQLLKLDMKDLSSAQELSVFVDAMDFAVRRFEVGLMTMDQDGGLVVDPEVLDALAAECTQLRRIASDVAAAQRAEEVEEEEEDE